MDVILFIKCLASALLLYIGCKAVLSIGSIIIIMLATTMCYLKGEKE